MQIVDAASGRLGDETAALLAVAAVIGQEVPLAVWGAVAGADEEALRHRRGARGGGASRDGVRRRATGSASPMR